MKWGIKEISIIIIIFLIVFVIGFYTGAKTTTEFGMSIIFKLIEKQKINISIDKEMIEKGIYQYKNNIGGCLFLEN